ncbi:hypothetical protein HN903_00270 [archaeon]|jgi:hypothetical protein|nr:hypothetical protein [archaeon]MBT7128172.1 hypothetical protein [archaeon]
MMMNKRLLVLLVGLFMFSSVLGLGVTPARTTIDFEPGLVRDVSFQVVNSDSEDINLRFSVRGDLAEYISPNSESGVILASEGSKSFSYNLNLPESLGPGLHVGEVVVMHVPDELNDEDSYLSATLAVVTQVHVYVPYPGKHANAKMYIYSASVGEDVSFVIPVISQGEFDLTSVRANVDIYDSAGEKVDSFGTKSVAIPSGAKKELVYDWEADVAVGEYIAKATVIYDDGTIFLEERFSVGSEELVLQEIVAKDFSLGDIAKLEMLVENKWSGNIDDVFIETEILNDRGGVVSSFKSSDYSVGALSEETFISYWDTAGVLEGDYDVEVSINYNDKSSKKNLVFDVSENELVVIGLGYVISTDAEGSSSTIIIILIVVLIMINLLWFFLFRKKFGKAKE